jgi:monovalent cation/proton antiporter MnhG/PhaG subunit
MPDLFTRLQVTSKASVFGMTCIISASALHFYDPAVTTRAIVIIAFVALTMPAATHLPRGQTILEAGDRLDVLVEPAELGRVREIFEA